MTAAHESKMGHYLHQVNGPALGIYQMEPATYRDIYQNFLAYREDLLNCVPYMPDIPSEIITDLKYATILARIHYYRVPEALPTGSGNKYVEQLAKYAKKYYNTEKGKAIWQDYYNAFLDLED